MYINGYTVLSPHQCYPGAVVSVTGGTLPLTRYLNFVSCDVVVFLLPDRECVGIKSEPPENEPWYCPRCTAIKAKRQQREEQDMESKKTSSDQKVRLRHVDIRMWQWNSCQMLKSMLLVPILFHHQYHRHRAARGLCMVLMFPRVERFLVLSLQIEQWLLCWGLTTGWQLMRSFCSGSLFIVPTEDYSWPSVTTFLHAPCLQVCPTCKVAYGELDSAMIGCDSCDDWYHW